MELYAALAQNCRILSRQLHLLIRVRVHAYTRACMRTHVRAYKRPVHIRHKPVQAAHGMR